MHELLATISGKSLDPSWEKCFDAFQAAAKEFFRPCQHIGRNKLHVFMFSNHPFRNFVPSFNGAPEDFYPKNRPKPWIVLQ